MAGDRLHELAGDAWADGRECEGIKKGVPGGIVSTVRLIFLHEKRVENLPPCPTVT